MHDLSGRRALFVGGSSGMGLAAARLFHKLGAEVILAGRSASRLDAARQSLGDAGSAATLAFDITDDDAVNEALSHLPAGGIDHLVITAASVTHGPFASQPVTELRAMFDTKFWGAYGLARAALPSLRDGGSIILLSGVLSRRPGINCAALGAACAAIEALTRGLALELGPRLRVNCIAPGMVRTELHDRIPLARREAMFQTTGSSLPVGRIGRPEEIAQAVLLAATSGYMTGHVLDMDGGHMVRQYATR
ncbi:MAG: SDR family oxidoreductase [Rhodobacteraceae bacterium]|nr:SDR family oxidoreductase [Paracoccaceae bacterium]